MSSGWVPSSLRFTDGQISLLLFPGVGGGPGYSPTPQVGPSGGPLRRLSEGSLPSEMPCPCCLQNLVTWWPLGAVLEAPGEALQAGAPAAGQARRPWSCQAERCFLPSLGSRKCPQAGEGTGAHGVCPLLRGHTRVMPLVQTLSLQLPPAGWPVLWPPGARKVGPALVGTGQTVLQDRTQKRPW